jgi:anti-sigma B factor antagonist
MLNISKESNATSLTVILEGRLDTTTAPDLEKELKDSLDDVTELIMDFEKLEYISSAGLRVLLSAQKIMSRQGEMKLIHVSDTIMEIFEVTGFADILTIE